MNRLWIVRLSLGLVLLVSVVSLVPFSISAQDSRDNRPLGDSGLPLPRFVSVNKSEANMRRGPGEDYPLLFRFAARNLLIKHLMLKRKNLQLPIQW